MPKYKRWVMIGSKYDLTELLEIARREGMKIICAESANFCCWYNLGVYTKLNRHGKTREWKLRIDVLSCAFQFNLDIPRDKWID